jgi:hypothetical protein
MLQFPGGRVNAGKESFRGDMTERRMPDSIGRTAQVDVGIATTQAVANGGSKHAFLDLQSSLIPARCSKLRPIDGTVLGRRIAGGAEYPDHRPVRRRAASRSKTMFTALMFDCPLAREYGV